MYLELRPDLRRLYVAVPELDEALAALAPLGFAPLPGDPVDMGGGAVWTLVNDFGPDSIDGWLGDVVLRELTADEPSVIDETGRRLVLDDRVIDLSPLELGLLQYLERKKGAAVTREELLREVWGHEWIGTSSNVVEAVVSGLRRKLGVHADVLETVRGVGYRLGPLS
ncbi:MAG TPA: winged helix-turn-helix domain-containing protein [Gaiellales bacterium]|nr:winged helix-turn-helix domain-containing protein [Gaiellales bacterium]